MHFFHPVRKMKLVEIVRGMDTSEQTILMARNVATRMGKETVEVNEYPGFIAGRLGKKTGLGIYRYGADGRRMAAD